MTLKKISKEGLTEWVDRLISGNRVIGVQTRRDKSDRFEFRDLTSANELRLDYDVVLQPPRKYFQPPVETLVRYDTKSGYDSVFEEEQFILFGVHPYDMIALNQMDRLFSQDYFDAHYMKRRKNAIIVAVDVATPSKNVFASSMGTATVHEGYDVLVTNIGNAYVVEAGTEKGEGILSQAKNIEQASAEDLEKRKKVWQENKKRLNKHELKCRPEDLPRLLEKAYNHPVWEEKAKTCFACGSCNQVCPTCYCFNVQDEVNWDLKSGRRHRAWDGCLLDGFTKVAGGHEFRSNRADRFRHRIYRKGAYVPSKIGGEIACVGCGRCVGACLPDIANPVNVYNRLVEDTGT